MKRSNKLLIAFAVALTLIPLLGMIYVSQVNYKTGTYEELSDQEAINEDKFNNASENMTSKELQAFTTVNVGDGKMAGVYIKFIKDDKFGVKVENELKDSVDFMVNATGELNIGLKTKSINRSNMYLKILIYGPNINQFKITNGGSIFLDAKGDSLKINAKNTHSISLQQSLSLNALTIMADQVKEVSAADMHVKELTLNLKDTNFDSERTSYEQLSITSVGKSDIEINGSDNGKLYSIKNLYIQTLNVSDVKLDHVKVDQCSGSFSDQTTVKMPAANLNQMYKAKIVK